jgi:hypothetical protein
MHRFKLAAQVHQNKRRFLSHRNFRYTLVKSQPGDIVDNFSAGLDGCLCDLSLTGVDRDRNVEMFCYA